MIKIILTVKDNKIIGFELSGHALYDEYGKDIVCAGISALAINTINSIEAFTDDKFDYTVDEASGTLKLHFISNISKESELLLNALKLGILGIKQQYGNGYIELIIEEV